MVERYRSMKYAHLFVKVSEDQDRNPVVDTVSIQGYGTQVYQKEQDAQLPKLSTRYCSSVETRHYPSQQHYTLVKVSSFLCTFALYFNFIRRCYCSDFWHAFHRFEILLSSWRRYRTVDYRQIRVLSPQNCLFQPSIKSMRRALT